MTVPIILLILGILGLIFFLKGNSQRREAEITKLEENKNTLQSKYDYMIDQKRELLKQIEDKENELARLRSGQEGIKTYTTKEMEIGEVDEGDKVSRYFIREGVITLEQDEKVRSKIKTLKMDYLGTCLTLGMIDIEMAKKAAKILKLSSKSLGA